MKPETKTMNRSVVFLIVIALFGILFVPVASAGIVVNGISEQAPQTSSASTNYQYITIDTGFPKLTPANYSKLDYTPMVPQLYKSAIQEGASVVNFIPIDTGPAPIIPTSYLKPQSPMQVPVTNPDIFYPECQSAGGLTNSFGNKGFFSLAF